MNLFAAELGATNLEGIATSNIRDFGRGKIGVVPVGANLASAVNSLFPTPLVEISGSHDMDVCARRLNGKLMINLVNTAGNHANRENKIVEVVPPIGPLQISIRLPKQPRSILVQPAGTKLDTVWHDGIARVTLSRLDIYSIVQVNE